MADDSEDDLFFVQRALDRSAVGKFFYGVKEGQEAIAYLSAEGKFEDRQNFPFPNLLLLDLKMPRLDGFGVLRWLQEHPHCRVLPTIVFTSSNLEKDVQEAYDLGANAFLMKPGHPEDLVQLIQITYQFWSHCQTPPLPPGQKCA